MPQPGKAIISKHRKMAFAKASNKALTLKVGALLFSIYNVIASLNFCTSISIMKASGGVRQ